MSLAYSRFYSTPAIIYQLKLSCGCVTKEQGEFKVNDLHTCPTCQTKQQIVDIAKNKELIPLDTFINISNKKGLFFYDKMSYIAK